MAAMTRWGILGTGSMSAAFVRALDTLPEAATVAVGSRNLASARDFAARSGIARAHGSYDDLLSDPEVDLVYVGTVNSTHRELCLRSLDAGKPVLCEKPFTLNAAEARAVVERAREKRLFCMEAMWTRFLPAVARLKAMVDGGEVGEARLFSASLGYPYADDPAGRQFNRALGGGALLDLGVYPISLACYLFGRPESVVGRASMTPTGVDSTEAIILVHPGGRISTLCSGLITLMPNEAIVMGTRGLIRLHEPLFRPDRLTIETMAPITPGGGGAGGGRLAWIKEVAAVRAIAARVKPMLATLRGRTRRVSAPPLGNGYPHQAIEAMRCVREGRLESPIMPLDESVAILEVMDELRRQWGLQFPGESLPDDAPAAGGR